MFGGLQVLDVKFHPDEGDHAPHGVRGDETPPYAGQTEVEVDGQEVGKGRSEEYGSEKGRGKRVYPLAGPLEGR